MEIGSVRLVYFSPTGTTKKVVEAIARGLGHGKVEHVDITLPEARKRRLRASASELLVVGVPVYFGRVQATAMEWLRTIEARQTPAVCVVVYGNRAFDDALIELKEGLAARGCIPVACAAFVGEHSFSGDEAPLAVGRPDEDDLDCAAALGEKIKEKLASTTGAGRLPDVAVPGNHPYMEKTEAKKMLSSVDFITVDETTCVQCGLCAEVCPVGAIDPANSASIDTGKCIVCCACIKKCPAGLRTIKAGPVKSAAIRLSATCADRKAPESFL